MSARIPPGYGEAVWILRLAGDPGDMIFSWGFEKDPGASATLVVTNNILDGGTPWLADLVSSVYTVVPGWITWGQDGSDDIRIDGTGATDAGDLGATALPQNVATLIRKVTALGGRRHRGRSYIPGLTEGSVGVTGVIDPAVVTQLQTAATGFMNAIDTNPSVVQSVLLHNSAPFTPTPLTSWIVQGTVATQRRRLRP